MSFLAPLFLLGAAAIALPIVFHLIRQTTRERTTFSSLMFLSPTPPRLTRRSRLEHLLLLLLRCLVLGLLAFGFSRPFFKTTNVVAVASKGVGHTVVLVDTSASMQRAGMWEQARDKALATMRQLPPGSSAALYSFDRQMNRLVTFEDWRQTPVEQRLVLAREKLESIRPGWGATRAGQALVEAAELLAEASARSSPVSGEIVLVTDLQEGARLDAIQGYEWPRNVRVRVEPVRASKASNASLALIVPTPDTPTGTNGGYRLRINNAPDSTRDQFQLGWVDGAGKFLQAPSDLHLPPGQTRTLPLPASPETNRSRLMLQGDEVPFDNSVAVAPVERVQARVLYLGSDPETEVKGELYFLRRAFQDTRTRRIQLVTNSPSAAPSGEMEGATLVVVSEPLGAEAVRALRARMSQGTTVLLTMGRIKMAETASSLLGEGTRLESAEAEVRNFALLTDIEFRHPLFAPFADPRFADFTKVRFWKYWKLDLSAVPQAQVLARFDSGDPAITEVVAGKGRLLILASSWRPGDSQLALSTKFVPLLHTLLDHSGAPIPPAPQFYVGDAVPLANGPGTAEHVVTRPDGTQETLERSATAFVKTSEPGVYNIHSGGADVKFVVNLDPAESRLMPSSVEELERLGAPLASGPETVAAEAARRERLKNSELENRQKMWRWLIVGALAVLLVETWLAGRSSRPAAQVGSAQA